MSKAIKLDVAAIECPICGEGQASMYEEVRAGKVVQPQPGGVAKIAYSSRYRVCDHCEAEFAGHEESRHNKEQVMALLDAYGAISFPERKGR
jgi:hypothetical protein